ncbi:MAG: GntR family transcriptional regulator [Bacteroidaceae bacterium]|nr:GntR family transcriptional regulator [Bacteroidaceae bacterium]MBR1520383.1 GntR family transcriptional regulator [Bacteroidaceae bacterium]
MQFKDNKAIYLQIADLICEDILQGKYAEDERIPSVREYAAVVEVNANTCARAYDWLQGQDIIYTKRGLGYFVCVGATDAIRQMKRQEFLTVTLPEVARQMVNLDITLEELSNGIIQQQMKN